MHVFLAIHQLRNVGILPAQNFKDVSSHSMLNLIVMYTLSCSFYQLMSNYLKKNCYVRYIHYTVMIILSIDIVLKTSITKCRCFSYKNVDISMAGSSFIYMNTIRLFSYDIKVEIIDKIKLLYVNVFFFL